MWLDTSSVTFLVELYDHSVCLCSAGVVKCFLKSLFV